MVDAAAGAERAAVWRVGKASVAGAMGAAESVEATAAEMAEGAKGATLVVEGMEAVAAMEVPEARANREAKRAVVMLVGSVVLGEAGERWWQHWRWWSPGIWWRRGRRGRREWRRGRRGWRVGAGRDLRAYARQRGERLLAGCHMRKRRVVDCAAELPERGLRVPRGCLSGDGRAGAMNRGGHLP